jgi:hypothetical protein
VRAARCSNTAARRPQGGDQPPHLPACQLTHVLHHNIFTCPWTMSSMSQSEAIQ